MKKKYFIFYVFILLIILVVGCKPKRQILTVWHTESDPKTQGVFTEIGDSLQKLYPNLTVNYEYVSWGQLSSKLKIAMQTDPENKLPNISHLEPYMAYSIYKENLLENITDIVNEIEANYKDSIFNTVRNLQKFDNQYYGIAQHVGVSFILCRKDILNQIFGKMPNMTKWSDFFDVCNKLVKEGHKYPIAIPGSSPFFMECIFSEYLNSNQARLFDDTVSANLENQKVNQVFTIIDNMARYVIEDYRNTQYLDQFDLLSKSTRTEGPVFIMFAGGRAFKNFESNNPLADTTMFASIIPPQFNTNLNSFTSVDCEPFVLFKKQDESVNAIAKEWYRIFYSKKFYLKFCESVPIQLIPIFPSLLGDYQQIPDIVKWHQWYSQAIFMISKSRVRPYFMQVNEREDLDFLFELYNSQIIYNLIIQNLRGQTNNGYIYEKADKEINELIKSVSSKY